MTADDLLLSEIDTKLGGDRERSSELFQDASFHSRLAALPNADGWRKYRKGHGDGTYFVAADAGYEVYYQERGSICGFYARFDNIADAAACFFAPMQLTASYGEPGPDLEPVRSQELTTDPGAVPGKRRHGAIEAIRTLVLTVLFLTAFLLFVGTIVVLLD